MIFTFEKFSLNITIYMPSISYENYAMILLSITNTNNDNNDDSSINDRFIELSSNNNNTSTIDIVPSIDVNKKCCASVWTSEKYCFFFRFLQM